MTVAELITVLNNHGFTDTPTADKVGYINDVVWDIVSLEPWRFLEGSVTFTWNGSSATPTNFPTDFKALLSVVDTSIPRKLEPIRIEEFKSRLGTQLTLAGDPIYYYFLASTFAAWPIPASTNTTTVMTYLKKQAKLLDTSVESDILIPREHHAAIYEGALAKLYFQDDDPELAAEKERLYNAKIMKMRNELWMVQYDRPDTIEIVDWDDLYS